MNGARIWAFAAVGVLLLGLVLGGSGIVSFPPLRGLSFWLFLAAVLALVSLVPRNSVAGSVRGQRVAKVAAFAVLGLALASVAGAVLLVWHQFF